jgi:hypothetical protein
VAIAIVTLLLRFMADPFQDFYFWLLDRAQHIKHYALRETGVAKIESALTAAPG